MFGDAPLVKILLCRFGAGLYHAARARGEVFAGRPGQEVFSARQTPVGLSRGTRVLLIRKF
jgi:hypothetical protein